MIRFRAMNPNEQDKQRQLDATRERFSSFSKQHLAPAPRLSTLSATKTGLIPMLVVWGIVMAGLYFAMAHYLKPQAAQVLANGDLVITRAQDGHFYTTGTINGHAAVFLVDTGASLVSVSEPFAATAGLRGGTPTTFKTANGDRPGRIVGGNTVAIGPVRVTNMRVGVGLSAGADNAVLLGQSFLSRFNITMGERELVLRPRQASATNTAP